jgi:DNA polymerase-3 subunit beta
MNFAIERRILHRGLEAVRSIVENRNTIPILSNVLLTLDGADLSLTATDLDIAATATVNTGDLAASGHFAITVPAGLLFDIVRKLPEGAEVSVSYSDADPRLMVKAGRSSVKLPVLPVGGFPTMALKPGATVDIPSDEFARLLDKTLFAASTEETRYYLNGVFIQTLMVDGVKMLRCVTTDGHRLALAQWPAPDDCPDFPGLIIPRKTAREIRKLVERAGDGGVALTLSPTQVHAEGNNEMLTSKVVEGSFPDYARVIPRDNQKIARMDVDQLRAAVDRVATISSEKARSAKMTLETGRLGLTVRNMEAGQADEEMEIDYEGPTLEIGFNARYLLDVLQRIENDEVEFRFDSPGSPVLVLDPGDSNVQFVVMPLRV